MPLDHHGGPGKRNPAKVHGQGRRGHQQVHGAVGDHPADHGHEKDRVRENHRHGTSFPRDLLMGRPGDPEQELHQDHPQAEQRNAAVGRGKYRSGNQVAGEAGHVGPHERRHKPPGQHPGNGPCTVLRIHHLDRGEAVVLGETVGHADQHRTDTEPGEAAEMDAGPGHQAAAQAGNGAQDEPAAPAVATHVQGPGNHGCHHAEKRESEGQRRLPGILGQHEANQGG